MFLEATRRGADYLVAARARVAQTAKGRLAREDLWGSAEITLKVASLPAGTVIVSEAREGRSATAAFTESELVRRTMKHVAGDAVGAVVKRVLASWDEESKSGVRCSVLLRSPTASEQVGILVSVLERVPGVQGVRTVRVEDGEAVVELFYPPGVDLGGLRRALLADLERQPDLQGIVGGTLVGRMIVLRAE